MKKQPRNTSNKDDEAAMNELRIDPFEERRKGLEEAFFKERDQELLKKLRSELEAFEERQKIAHVSGITDDKVLTDLVQAGVKAESLLVMRLAPLVMVAWCDGMVAAEERAAVLNAAAALDIHPGSAPYEVLDRWLQEPPDDRVVTAWKEYVKALARILPAPTVKELRKQMVDRCTRVAAAAGGFLGLATISHEEKAKIDEFARAWDG
jgi:hypothetical protein